MGDTPIDEFEAILRQVMASRPEPNPAIDLASVAMRLARADATHDVETFSRISRVYRRNHMVGIVAAALVAVILLMGGLRLSTQGAATNSSADSVQSNSASISSGTELSRPIVLLTGEALLAALVLLSLGGSLMSRPGASVNDLIFH